MKRLPPRRYAALLALSLVWSGGELRASRPQDDTSATAILRSRARTLEQRGRLDLAQADWAQVLAADPNDAEALAGLVRAARAADHSTEAAQYLARLKAAHPGDPALATLEGASGATPDRAALLRQAAQLARGGDNRGAMVLYRRAYGSTPPSGPAALPYYETESATEEGRPHAIAGLRALVDRFPDEPHYSITLGRVLLASLRTRAEGRTLLERYPQSPDAVAALRELAPPANTSSSAAKTTFPVRLPASAGVVQSAAALRSKGTPTATATSTPGTQTTAGAGTSPSPVAVAPGVPHGRAAIAAEEQAGFAALNAHRVDEAERHFEAVLAADPSSARALAGMGYVQSTRGDLKAAVNLFERAQESGDRSLALTRALISTQDELALRQASATRTQGNLPDAEERYRAVLRVNPNEPTALDGLAETLLDAGQAQQAASVFAHLTEVRPLSPAAWRGLVIAQLRAGDSAGALASSARVPANVRTPLAQDASYSQAVATARAQQAVAQAETPPRPGPPRASVTPSAPTTPSTPPRQQAVAPSPAPALPPRQQALAAPPAPAKPAPPSSSATVRSQAGTSAGVSGTSKPAPSTSSLPPSAPTAQATQTLPPAAVQPPHGAPPPSAVAAAASSQPASPLPPTSARARAANAGSPPRAGASRAGSLSAAATPPAAPVRPPTQPGTLPSAPVTSAAEVLAAERDAQGEAALLRGDTATAATFYRDALAAAPDRSAAWRGLVEALSAADRDQEAVTALAGIPDRVRAILGRDATFLTAEGRVYTKAGRPNEALRSLARAQEVFAEQKLPPPLDLVLRVAGLLAARGDDPNLYRELMYLGSRRDLNDRQRQQVQMIWTQWAVRRARALAAAGEQSRAVVVLNATVEAFAGNAEVLHTVANGYAGVGLAREAVALFRAQDMTQAPAHELETAVRAAVQARDFRVAEGWLRQGRARFPADAGMLTTAAEYEQARGHEQRALELSQQAKALAPAQDPGLVLVAELREAEAGTAPVTESTGRLATLLAPAEAATLATSQTGSRPFLPGAAGTSPAVGATLTPVLPGYDGPLPREAPAQADQRGAIQ